MRTARIPGSLRLIDRMEWLADDAQAKAWLYVNLEDSQPNHIKTLIILHALWEAAKKLHGAQAQGRLTFLRRKIFNCKPGAIEAIGSACSNLSRLQMIIQDSRSTKAQTDLDITPTLINLAGDEARTLAKYHLEEMERGNPILAQNKSLELVEQKIKDDLTTDEAANRLRFPWLIRTCSVGIR